MSRRTRTGEAGLETPGRSGNRTVKVVAGVALVGTTAMLATGYALSHDDAPQTPAAVTTSTAEVTRTDVAERRFVSGTLGFAGSHPVLAPGPGTVTRLPAMGTTVGQGKAIYEVDGRAVTLMYGARPVWRDFTVGMTDGVDVKQLETGLRQLGHGAGMTVDKHFSSATATAVRRWQRATRLTVTGSVPLGQVVFLPGAVRVSGHDVQLGAPVQPGGQVEHVTDDEPAVSVQAQPQQLPTVRVGDRVVVTLPDGKTREGRITVVGAGTPSTSGGTTGTDTQNTIALTVKLDRSVSGFVDRASVSVAIVRSQRSRVLAVPITALNAVPGGGYEVVVVDGSATRRVPVRTGLFDELAGLAEVSGADLAEGQRVQVPRADA